jgi:hypothetical protein
MPLHSIPIDDLQVRVSTSTEASAVVNELQLALSMLKKASNNVEHVQ